MTVNKDNVRLWVEALRSGKYKQARAMLENVGTGGMCCLGVACRVAMDAGLPVERTTDWSGRVRYDGHDALAPLSVLEWLGLDHGGNIAVRAEENGRSYVVTELNDTYDWDFNMIADAVEREYLS